MKKLRSIVAIVVVVTLVGVFAVQTKKETNEIKIGAILPLTGDLATYGENAKDGITLLSEEINANGGINGKRLVIFFEDSQAKPELGVTTIQKLINMDKVLAIVGDVASSPVLAFAPIANKNKIVVVSPAASSPDITNAGSYIYRIWPSDVFEADKMADYIKKQNAKKVALLYVNNDYGRAMVQEFKTYKENTNIIVSEENFEQNTTDVRGQIAKINKSNPEFIYLISYPKDSIIILRQAKEGGIKAKILSTSSFEDPLILKEIGDIAEGTIFTSPIPPEEKNLIVSEFKNSYKKRFMKDAGLVADYGYDALGIIIEALRISGKISKEGINEGIQKIKDYQGVTGLINFDKNGDVIKQSGIKVVKNKEYIWLEK